MKQSKFTETVYLRSLVDRLSTPAMGKVVRNVSAKGHKNSSRILTKKLEFNLSIVYDCTGRCQGAPLTLAFTI